MGGYYDERLAAERLRRCYEIAPARVRRYLEAEMAHVLSRVRRGDNVLELGCGYGRVLDRLDAAGARATGIDTSGPSLDLARREGLCTRLAAADAVALPFRAGAFDMTVCIQNGISAFRVDPGVLLAQAARVTRGGGRLLVSTYADAFWPHRLEWFRRQAAANLLGEIDEARTGNGVIVCRDGFTATTLTPADLERLARQLGVEATITEVDGSSLFCELRL